MQPHLVLRPRSQELLTITITKTITRSRIYCPGLNRRKHTTPRPKPSSTSLILLPFVPPICAHQSPTFICWSITGEASELFFIFKSTFDFACDQNIFAKYDRSEYICQIYIWQNIFAKYQNIRIFAKYDRFSVVCATSDV